MLWPKTFSIITKPTHITELSCTVLDHIINTNIFDKKQSLVFLHLKSLAKNSIYFCILSIIRE